MEKMGWSQGQGLGKHKHGTTEFLRSKKKQDTAGTRWLFHVSFCWFHKISAVRRSDDLNCRWDPVGLGATASTRDETFLATNAMYNDLLKRLNEQKGRCAVPFAGAGLSQLVYSICVYYSEEINTNAEVNTAAEEKGPSLSARMDSFLAGRRLYVVCVVLSNALVQC